MTGKISRHPARPRWVSSWARALWPDQNPLRRPGDRFEAAILAGLLVLFLIGAPLAALAGWQWAAGAGTRAELAQRSGRYQVPATLLVNASYQAYAWSSTLVRARWTAPDGAARTGEVSALTGTPRGSTVPIWTDRDGRALGPPLRPGQVRSQALLAAVVAPLVLAFALITAGMLVHQGMERRRLTDWAADWRVTGPQWSRQL
jgi:hypothetical protein